MSPLRSRGHASLVASLLAAAAVVVVAGAAHAQTPRSAAQSRASVDPPVAAGARDSSSAPQTFDWWTRSPIPATMPWGQAVDTASTRLIRSWTTMPEYTTSLVDHLPEDARVVSPTDHFGHPIGKPGVLHRVDEIYGYFTALAASTPRVRFERLGETEEGNHLALVQIGSEANLARLETVKRGMVALADPRTTDSAAAARLVADLPVVYTFYAGLHSTETGPPEMVMELAYRLAVSDAPAIRTIRDSVVVFIIPVAEPDGRNRVVDWHRRHNANVTDYDDRVPGPPYWGSYIFHDNNRDGIQLSARLTQEAVKLFEEWKYPIGHDLHESVPYLYVSTGTGPYNRELDPIAIGEWQWMSNWEVTDLTARGLPGVWTHGFYDGWYPGYLLWVTNTRNAVGRFYETFGNSIPATVKRELGARQTGIEWYRPSPPRKETLWSLRNNTNYMQSGALSVLELTSRNRARLLSQYREKALHAVERGRREQPHAYVVPVEQPRRADAAYMVDLLRRQGIEVHRAEKAGTFGKSAVAAGDYVVRMDQPYRNFVKMLMDVQRFPENAPRPYDDVAWTFPYMFNVEVRAVDDSTVLRSPMRAVESEVRIPGSLTTARRAAWWVVAPEASAHAVGARFALRDVPVYAAEESLTVAGRALPPGAWLVEMARVDRARMDSLARAHGLVVLAAPASAVEAIARHEMDLPRIALLHSWRNTQDEGWARFTLERMGVPYTYIGEDKLRRGMKLAGQFDVVLFPSQGANSDAKEILQGVDPKFSPLPYTKTADFPTHGFPDSTSDMTGGMGYEGLAALRDFVQQGGTLITLGSASRVPVGLGLVREVSLDEPRNLFVPGSIVRGRVAQATNPLVYGYGAAVPLYHRFGPYFEVPDRLKGNIVLKYAEEDSVFMSGLVQSPGELAGKPAIVALPTGKGTIVLFGFDPLHRFQSHGNFALVWNAIMNWNDLGVGLAKEGEDAVADGQ